MNGRLAGASPETLERVGWNPHFFFGGGGVAVREKGICVPKTFFHCISIKCSKIVGKGKREGGCRPLPLIRDCEATLK